MGGEDKPHQATARGLYTFLAGLVGGIGLVALAWSLSLNEGLMPGGYEHTLADAECPARLRFHQRPPHMQLDLCDPYGGFRRGGKHVSAKTSGSGAWISPTCDGSYFLDTHLASVMGSLMSNGTRRSVLELGAGCGCYTRFWMANFDLCVDGYDGLQDADRLTAGVVRQADFIVPRDFGMHDWVVCLEVGEHIPAQFESVLMESIASFARVGIIMSWAQPGYGGNGHINNKPKQEVITQMEALGVKYSDRLTKQLRSAAGKACCIWFRDTILVFLRQ